MADDETITDELRAAGADTTQQKKPASTTEAPKIAAPEQHEFWATDSDYGVIEDKDGNTARASLFEGKLSEDQLLADERWIKASREIYMLEHKGDPVALAKLDTMSNEQIAKFGVSYYGQFNYNMSVMGYETFQFTNDATPAQKKAMLFMMDAYEHKSMSADGWGRAIKGIFTDPASYIGLATFGFGLAAKEGGKVLAKEAFKKLLKESVKTGITAEIRTDLKKQAVRQATIQTVKSGAQIAAFEGAVYMGIDSPLRQSIEIQTVNDLNIRNAWRNGEFSFWRMGGDVTMGAVFGGVLGGVGSVAFPAIGRGLRSFYNNTLETTFNKMTASLDETVRVAKESYTTNATVKSPDAQTKSPIVDVDGEPVFVMAGGAPRTLPSLKKTELNELQRILGSDEALAQFLNNDERLDAYTVDKLSGKLHKAIIENSVEDFLSPKSLKKMDKSSKAVLQNKDVQNWAYHLARVHAFNEDISRSLKAGEKVKVGKLLKKHNLKDYKDNIGDKAREDIETRKSEDSPTSTKGPDADRSGDPTGAWTYEDQKRLDEITNIEAPDSSRRMLEIIQEEKDAPEELKKDPKFIQDNKDRFNKESAISWKLNEERQALEAKREAAGIGGDTKKPIEAWAKEDELPALPLASLKPEDIRATYGGAEPGFLNRRFGHLFNKKDDPEKLIPAPYRSMWHRAVWLSGLPMRLFPFMEARDPSQYLPNDFTMGKFMRPVIDAVDNQIHAHHLIPAFDKLNKEMQDIANLTKKGSISTDEARKKIHGTLQQFRKENANNLRNFDKALQTINDEVLFEKDLANMLELKRKGEGFRNFEVAEGSEEDRLIKAFERDNASAIRRINTIKISPMSSLGILWGFPKKFMVAAYKSIFNRDDFSRLSSLGKEALLKISEYETRSGRKLTDKNKLALIENIDREGFGTFHINKKQAETMDEYITDLQSVARKLADPKSDFMNEYNALFDELLESKGNSSDQNISKTVIESLWDIKKLTGNTNQEKSANTAQRLQDRYVYNGWRFIPTWLGGNAGLRINKIEDLDAQVRMFDVGYYNKDIRTAPLANGPGDRDNTERNAIQIEMVHELPEIKTGKKTVTNYLDGQTRIVYDLGREWEVIKSFQRLNDLTGGDVENMLPQGDLNNLLSSDKDRPDRDSQSRAVGKMKAIVSNHYSRFYKAVVDETAFIKHSPYIQDQRRTMRTFTKASWWAYHGKRFAGESEIATPAWDDIVVGARNRWSAGLKAYLTGGYVAPAPDPQARGPIVRWMPELKEGEKRTWEDSAKLRAGVVGKAALNWSMLPFYPGIAATRALMKSTAFKKTGLWVGVPGGVTMAVEESAEQFLDDKYKPDFMTNDKGDFVIPGTNIDLDIGSRFGLYPMIKATNLVMMPMQLQGVGLKWLSGTFFNSSSMLGTGIQPGDISLDNRLFSLSDINSGATSLPLLGTPFGDRDDGKATPVVRVSNPPPSGGQPQNQTPTGGAPPGTPPGTPSGTGTGGTGSSSGIIVLPAETEEEKNARLRQEFAAAQAREAQRLADEKRLADLNAKDNLSAAEIIERENLETRLRNHAAQNSGQNNQNNNRNNNGGTAMPTSDEITNMITALNSGKSYINGTPIDGKGEILAGIDQSVTALGNNPDTNAVATAKARLQEIDTIRENLGRISDLLATLQEHKTAADARSADAHTLSEIERMKAALQEAKKNPQYSAYTMDEAGNLISALRMNKASHAADAFVDKWALSEFKDEKNPLHGSFTHGKDATFGWLGAAWDNSMNYGRRVLSGKEGAGAQAFVKYGGGLLAGILAVKMLDSWIDSTPILNLPIIKQLVKIALFVAAAWGAARWAESGMNTEAAVQTSNAGRHVPYRAPASFDPKNNNTAPAQTPSRGRKDQNGTVHQNPNADFISIQSNKGEVPKTMPANPEERIVFTAYHDGAKSSASHCSQGSGKHLCNATYTAGGILASGKGLYIPLKDPLLAREGQALETLGSREHLPHEDHGIKQLVSFNKEYRPEYEHAEPAPI